VLGDPAINDATGYFEPGSRSWWSTADDGASVAAGGAASMLGASRSGVYTYLGDTVSGTGASVAFSDEIDEANSALTKEELGIESESDDYRTNLINWIKGGDVRDVDEDGNTTEPRNEIADPLHSSPSVVIYGGTDAAPVSTIFFGDNQGYLHGINGETGAERFAFMPKELLPLQKTLYENSAADTHAYGLDGQVTTWVNDENGDGVIEGNECAGVGVIIMR